MDTESYKRLIVCDRDGKKIFDRKAGDSWRGFYVMKISPTAFNPFSMQIGADFTDETALAEIKTFKLSLENAFGEEIIVRGGQDTDGYAQVCVRCADKIKSTKFPEGVLYKLCTATKFEFK